MLVGVDLDCLSTFVDLAGVPSVTPTITRGQIHLLSPLTLLPDWRNDKIAPVHICPPVGPCSRSCRINHKQWAYYRHAGLSRFLSILIVVVDQPFMQSRVETPNRDELAIVTRLARKVPEGNVAGWTNFHDRVQRTKREPAPANFLFQQLLVVTANVRTPVWITHDRGTL